MKKIFSNVMLVAAAAMTFFACQKPETINPETSAEDVVLTFSSEKPAFDDETKTEWTGETIQWSKGDAIRVAYTVEGIWQNATGDASGDAKLYKSDALKSAAETAMFNVNTTFTGTNEGVHIFYGVYPAPSSTDFPNAPVATLVIPSIQTPGLSSFDGSADLMVGVSSDKYTKLPEKEETISLKWNRLVAHANITLTSLNGVTEGETISTIKLTAQDGANLVGSQKVDIQTLEITNDNGESNVVVLNGGNLTIDASGNIEFWACILPETITALTVEVTTDKAIYTRKITGINKTFKQNARNTLAVNMATATREAKEAESWVLVTPADGLTEGTYALVASTKNKTGVLVSTNGSSSAPTFDTSITVEGNVLKGVSEAMQFDLAAADKSYTLAVAGQTKNYLYTTNSNNGVRIGTEPNNVWTIDQHESESDAFVFKCNATSRYLGVYNDTDWRCYTAYDAQNFTNETGSSKIYLYKKTAGDVQPDTTPKLSAPKVTAELNDDKTGIDVSWTAVDNATSYVVSCTNQDDVTVTETSYSFIDLAAGAYTITVLAKAENYNSAISQPVEVIVPSSGDGPELKTFVVKSDDIVSNSGYAAYTKSLDSRSWVITWGGNNKSIGTNSGNRSKCNLAGYSKYAVSPVQTSSVASAFASTTSISNVSKISYAALTGGSNHASTKIYVLYSADGKTFSQISLISGEQGATINTTNGGEFEFASCSGYFAVVFVATNQKGNWRLDDVNLTFTYSE